MCFLQRPKKEKINHPIHIDKPELVAQSSCNSLRRHQLNKKTPETSLYMARPYQNSNSESALRHSPAVDVSLLVGLVHNFF